MGDFFDKYLNIPKILEGKREYRSYMNRVNALPEDYRYMFDKVQNHLWKFAGGDGMDMLELQYGFIELLEEGAAENKPVLEITGDDVAAFCDELLRETETYTEKWRADLNRDIMDKLGGQDETK